jgi:Alw26I/Eco31I/Esp3I family type II restriction m6 adenine DNA methyltransferase
MEHIALARNESSSAPKSLEDRALGRFYTPLGVARNIAERLIDGYSFPDSRVLKIVDPFCGDGRLIVALLESLSTAGKVSELQLRIVLVDVDRQALSIAIEKVSAVVQLYRFDAHIETHCADSFSCLDAELGAFDFVITNPPWETLKPDRRELNGMTPASRVTYREQIKNYDCLLRKRFPESVPTSAAFHPASNLARVGTTLSARLTNRQGRLGIVLPASLLNDRISSSWRQWLFRTGTVCNIDCYPAEAKVFKYVDQPTATLIWKPECTVGNDIRVRRLVQEDNEWALKTLYLQPDLLEALDYGIPDVSSLDALHLLGKLSLLPTLSDLESDSSIGLRLGRELDETGIESKLADVGTNEFVRGKMIGRYLVAQSERYLRSDINLPKSVDRARLVWRDISRRNQRRRMQAALIPPGVVTGNSLNIGYFLGGNRDSLFAFLAFANSLVFEFQIRARLGTGHLSVGSMRGVCVPKFVGLAIEGGLANVVRRLLEGDTKAEAELEVSVARAYGLSRSEFELLLGEFRGLPERDELLRKWDC